MQRGLKHFHQCVTANLDMRVTIQMAEYAENMSKPEAFSVPHNTNMTCNTSHHPLLVGDTKQDEDMQAVDSLEKASALPRGVFYSVLPPAVLLTVYAECFETVFERKHLTSREYYAFNNVWDYKMQ